MAALDAFIGPLPADGTRDDASYFGHALFSYTGSLYYLISNLKLSGFAPPVYQMMKSTDSGVTWNTLPSTLTGNFAGTSGVARCLIGTKLYMWYIPSALPAKSGLASFDFTTELFTAISTSGNISAPVSKFLSGPDANHLFTVHSPNTSSFVISKYTFNVFAAIGSIAVGPFNPPTSYNFVIAQEAICGSSGIFHVLYEASKSTSGAVGPSDLGYVNVVNGVISSTTVGNKIIYPNYSDSFLIADTGTGLGQPLQIGSTIYASFYDPFAQQIKLLKFQDVASPAFTTSIIDSAWPISQGPSPSGNEPGTGSWSNALAYYGGILYCFYDNTWISSGVNVGDSTLYYKSSSDGGVTWSGRAAIVVHHDPVDHTPFKIWYPTAMEFVGTQPSSLSSIFIAYAQAQADSMGLYGFNSRFITQLFLFQNYVDFAVPPLGNFAYIQ